MTVSVLAGGPSAEHDVSLESGAEMLDVLARGGRAVRPVRIARDGGWRLGTPGQTFAQLDDSGSLSLDAALVRLAADGDVLLIGLHGRFGEDGQLQHLLERAGIPFTGSGAAASRIGMDKELSKLAASRLGARCASHEVLRGKGVPAARLIASVGLPCIAKPLRGGSSVGAVRVRAEAELEPAVRCAQAEDPEGSVLVEAWLDGTEVSCGALRIAGQLRTLPIVAIRPADGNFYDYHAKYAAADTRLECPARLDDAAAEEIHRLTAALYAALELRGVARMDFIVRADNGQPTFLELNTLPGFTAHSLVPMAAAAEGLSRLELLDAVLADVGEAP